MAAGEARVKAPSGVQAPIVILAAQIVEDVSELCTRMAIINHGKPLDPSKGVEQGRRPARR